jgi:hypothetical protein
MTPRRYVTSQIRKLIGEQTSQSISKASIGWVSKRTLRTMTRYAVVYTTSGSDIKVSFILYYTNSRNLVSFLQFRGGYVDCKLTRGRNPMADLSKCPNEVFHSYSSSQALGILRRLFKTSLPSLSNLSPILITTHSLNQMILFKAAINVLGDSCPLTSPIVAYRGIQRHAIC